ncbi:hypothetical protein B0H63DRAFT_543672 [Podospora didyma]|uniref:Uncharacterized protein n=1 Tax=Podospora didyma TaxID=330526 RepID=A0AAE0TZK3_9PEZI|nr:hypothetical protein B0H63DRAFT_543672 [Podospora didyma]
MVGSTLFTLALLALSHAVNAAPTAEVTESVTSTFSFRNWVEGIIANPNGNNLTPEEAVADAVACINELARRGGDTCRANSVSVFCRNNGAQITGVAGGGVTNTASSCNDVARGAGFVMDHCTRADNTVQGAEFAYGNGNLLVWIRRPS